MDPKSVFFRKVLINENTKNVTLYVTSKPLSTQEVDFMGVKVQVRVQDTIVFGQLNMVDPSTGTSMKSNHPLVKKLKTLKPGAELKGFTINTDAPVRDLETGEPLNNLYWVEAAL